MSNYATLNQFCIQAHSSSLRCGGSLCKVQSDNISPPHSNSLPIGRENKMPFSIRPTMRFRVVARNDNALTAPHPNPPRAGEGTIVFLNPFNRKTLNQLCIQAHSSSLRCGGSLCKVQSDK